MVRLTRDEAWQLTTQILVRRDKEVSSGHLFSLGGQSHTQRVQRLMAAASDGQMPLIITAETDVPPGLAEPPLVQPLPARRVLRGLALGHLAPRSPALC